MERKHPRWVWLRVTGGILLIIAGIVSGFLPIVQGWLLILAGLALLAPHFPPAERLLVKLREKFKRRQP
ncbi:MAG TPA: PGPGW domain-containing protein [bacterium]|nr:PGPGW domain-containing protein [bacterium]